MYARVCVRSLVFARIRTYMYAYRSHMHVCRSHMCAPLAYARSLTHTGGNGRYLLLQNFAETFLPKPLSDS
jgi:hypothetical protein